jgi:glycosyltransferase involved in cell wall biosynthesis
MQLQARRLAGELIRRGTEVRFLSQSLQQSEGEWKGIPVRWFRARSEWEFALRLPSALREQSGAADVVHVHGFGPEAFAAMAARRRIRMPVVVKPSTAGPGTRLHTYAVLGRLGGQLFLPLWRGADAWIAVSEQVRGDLLALGVPAHRIHLIPNGVDLGLFHPVSPERRLSLRRRFGAEGATRVIVTVARLRTEKRVDAVIRALGRVGTERTRLWVIGTGHARDGLDRLASRLNGAVEFLGGLRPGQVAERLQAADLFVLLSMREGLSNALLEAQACGLPALVSDVSGMAEVIRPANSGWLVPDFDELRVAEALRAALCGGASLEEMGRRAVAQVRERFSLQRTAALVERVYASCRGANGN